MEVNVGEGLVPGGGGGGGDPVGGEGILDKFPDEIWTIIFGNLYDSSTDLLNCTRVCTKWERILKSDQCTWLFDQVFPHIFPYLDKRDVLTSRLVDKRWRKITDDFVENHESRLPFDENRSHIGHRPLNSALHFKKIKWNAFPERENLTRFMDLMGETEKNPLFGRALWLEFQEEVENEDDNFQENSKFWTTVFQFLKIYGRHVWYFTIGTYGTRNTYGRFLYLLQNCLILLPNLKSLHMFGWVNESGEDAENNLTVEEIPAYLENHPLPILPFLETLEIDNMSGLPSAIQDHLISRHSEKLKNLQLSDWEGSRLVTNIELPQLKELFVDVSRYRPMEKIGNLLTHLANSPVGKISLSFSSVECTLDMERLFELLGNFGGTLRSLRLSVIPGFARSKDKSKVVWNEETAYQLKLVAPRLQALHLEGFSRLPLTFLIHLSSSLEYLEIRPLSLSPRTTNYPNEVIDLYQYLHANNVYDSRIWVDLPKLKKIYFEICNQCLSQYEDRFFYRATYEFLEELKKIPSLSV